MSYAFFGKSTILDGSSPYMMRLWVGRLRLHIFYRGDKDPDCHDHPWDFWTLPLTPYVEEVAVPDGLGGFKIVRQVVPAFRLTFRPATHCHRVIGSYAGVRNHAGEPYCYTGRKIITIVWRGGKSRPWGFLKNRNGAWCWSPWREYIRGGGKDAPCSQGKKDL